jgi:peptidyl-prolyl cis-trans isomerase A (cyclophilin A)
VTAKQCRQFNGPAQQFFINCSPCTFYLFWYIAFASKYKITTSEYLNMSRALSDRVGPTKTLASKFLVTVFIAAALLVIPPMALAKTAVIETPLGDIEIELLEADAPNTVANFLNYIENDRYNKTFMHRSVPGFVIQGGGFSFIDDTVFAVDTFASVDNEFKVSNTRGTLAMAKQSGLPDSATSQWFINLADNSASLDSDNGGYTVFAKVIGDGMAIVDAISQVPVIYVNSTFSDLPVIDFAGGTIHEENLVMTTVTEKPTVPVENTFVMNAGLNDAWYNSDTDGQGFFITVFPDLGFVSLAWFTYDTDLPAEDASANLGDPGHRWMTALGTINGNSSVMNIEFASGGKFDSDIKTDVTDPPGSAGTITLTFSDCGSGLVEYDIISINQQGSVPIQRVVNDNVALCEALTGE